MEGANDGAGIGLDNGRKLSLCTTTLSHRCKPPFALVLPLSPSLTLLPSLSVLTFRPSVRVHGRTGTCEPPQEIPIGRGKLDLRTSIDSS